MPDGGVFLVGAGPGDPELLTLRGRELLASADVVVYDRLVHVRLLDSCRRGAELICVGKRAGGSNTTQKEIDRLLVKKAKQGHRVVRLKGGDPLVFGRGGEEARHLEKSGIPFEFVPGISAAIAASAYAGIPLTHREVASTLVFATGHEDPSKRKVTVDWRSLGGLKGTTLCIYMGMARLGAILDELQSGGLPPDTPAACIQWASLGSQRTVEGTAASLAKEAERAGLTAPAIVIVGEVVRLRESMAWFEKRPLLGRRIVVTRSRQQAGELRHRIESLGAEVLEVPLVQIEKKIDPTIAEEIFEELGNYDWLVFSSANGVRHFFDAFFERFDDIRSLGLMRIAVVGEATAQPLRELHVRVDIVPDQPVAESLAKALVDTGSLDSAKILVVTGNEGRDVLIKTLEEARGIVDRFPVYHTSKSNLEDDPVAADFRTRGADAVLFTSSSGVQSFVDQAAALKLAADAMKPLAGSIGPITSETMRTIGMPVDFEAKTSSLDALIQALVQRLAAE